jgi:hypothetical protein
MGGGVVNSTSSPTESAIATINSLANESEAMNLTADLGPMSVACKSSSAKSQCDANNQVMVNWGEWAAGNGTTLSGGWVNTYNNTNACMAAQIGPLASGDSVTRTSTGMGIKGLYSGMIVWSTNPHMSYDNTTIPGTGLTVSRFANTRTISLNGLRRSLQDKDGKTVYDHSIMSLGVITMTGARTDGTRTIVAGTVRVFNNTERTRTDSTLSGVMWKNKACCYPTAGSITSTLTGLKTGSSQITFKDRCGEATLSDAKGANQSIILKQCE